MANSTSNNLTTYFILAAIFSLLVLVFVSSDIAIPVIRNIVIVLSGISALIFEYLVQLRAKKNRNQIYILMVLTILTMIMKFIA